MLLSQSKVIIFSLFYEVYVSLGEFLRADLHYADVLDKSEMFPNRQQAAREQAPGLPALNLRGAAHIRIPLTLHAHVALARYVPQHETGCS